ncbi:SDR family oxidoreductase [Paenibacillus lycopersici]|uniref:SDR family oxidoreductase n=1 Tax=Paenibacillus lycopersici TaxID=2704462 RepID=A0A6C0FV55_9BACL|nr:SDR family oxidoreductase [Paenibacillus lycopersici]QHT61018.1 SDR family oxidoreductase [Paenibacillus lycopersici]
MKIAVIGGSGLIGRGLVQNLNNLGHEAVAASPSLGVNSVTGEGLAAALAGAQVVVDVTNSPSFEEQAVLTFFATSTGNLLAEAANAGVQHYVALSIVGTDRPPGNAYFNAKVAQEKLIQAAGIPYTIVRATQFFEFAGAIAYTATEGQTVRLPSAAMQPIAAADVSAALAAYALDKPVNGIVDLAGPEKIGMDEFVRLSLRAAGDKREVVTDNEAGYFGGQVDDSSLVPADDGKACIAATRLADWLARS